MASLGRIPTGHLHARRTALNNAQTPDALAYDFLPHQTIPDGQWSVCMFQAGRGAGKSWTGAAWSALQAEQINPNADGVLVAPTFKQVREVMVEHRRSGILAMLGDRVTNYNRSTFEITTRTGSRIYMRSAEDPDSLRGLSVAWSWADELASWTYPAAWHEGLVFALRESANAQTLVTTTPKPVQLVKELNDRAKDPADSVVLMRASTMDNTHLPAQAVAEMRRQYDGKRLGRQELYGELIEEVDGALWAAGWIVVDTPPPLTEFSRIVVGVDPSGGRDEVGIVAAGITYTGTIWVLADRSGHYSTSREWAATAVNLADELGADRIVAERNFGGDMVRDTIENYTGPGKRWLVQMVTASRGKRTRAEPVAVLYEPGEGQPPGHTVKHAQAFPALTDQMLTWVPGIGTSPDRVDALVWAVIELTGGLDANAGWASIDDILGPGGLGNFSW